MRKLASFDDESRARVLARALRAEDIASEVRSSQDASHSVWIMLEDQLDTAKQLLAAFLADPEAERFHAARVPAAPEVVVPRPRSVPPSPRPPQMADMPRPRVIRARAVFQLSNAGAPITTLLLFGSMAIAVLTELGDRTRILKYFTIASFVKIGGMASWHGYEDINHGELWRLFTPALIHFGIFHLLFNAFWLLDFGGTLERFQGPLRFALFVAAAALISNLAEFELGGQPVFGGLSGIIYALMGYLWVRGRLDPLSGVGIAPPLVTFFLVLLVLGFTDVLSSLGGPRANYCHLGGLVTGAFYGYVAARRAQSQLRP
ncbi:MAG TPA: rhomboid family intramembrane serine protease [Polyangiales bacterium]|jgi:GlpG protein|nr:rhomboid family intramembrane serine protease [Polyangiales bacterium]